MNFDKPGESLAARGRSRTGEIVSRRAWAGVRAVKPDEHWRRGSGGVPGSHRISSEGYPRRGSCRRGASGRPGDTDTGHDTGHSTGHNR